MRFFFLIALSILFLFCDSKNTSSQSETELPEPIVQPLHTVASKNAEKSDRTARPQPDSQHAPRITFDQVRFNFGKIYHADKVKHDFTFTNHGDRDLLIEGARASCGCTTPTYPTAPIKPGENGAIAVTYNSVGKQGAQKAKIWVTTNDPTNPEVVLYLSGRVLVKPRGE